MIRDNYSKQTVLDFFLPFDGKLDPENRWVKLSETIPWEEIGLVYNRSMKSKMGPPALPSRVVVGALIIKHLKKLPDEEVIEDIRENPYYQFFLGFKNFEPRTVFDPSLFVEIRKRLGMERIKEINDLFLSNFNQPDHDDQDPPSASSDKDQNTENPSSPEPENKGMLIIDATVAPGDIRYPTDVGLLNQAREIAEDLIDQLWYPGLLSEKPRTYRRQARKRYLAFTRQRNAGYTKTRKAVRHQLGYVRRDLAHIDTLLDIYQSENMPIPFDKKS